MKKFLLLASTLFFLSLSHATIHTVQVQNFQFNPATVNAVVGDTMEWVWVNGSHTTTSTEIPAGAAEWNSPIRETEKTFRYKLTVEGTYSYWCIPHAPEMAGTIEVTGVLPVTLTAFNITASGKNASIQWRTSNEQNVAYYTIKRSNDGTNFTSVGQVQATNTIANNTYTFTDNSIVTADKYLYYYLEIVDKDGSRTSSAIQSFKNILSKTGFLRQVAPNPVNGANHLMLQFYADKAGKMLGQLYDAKGTLIKQSEMSAVVGLNNAHFHTGMLAAGTYVLQCTMDGKKETRQVVVQ